MMAEANRGAGTAPIPPRMHRAPSRAAARTGVMVRFVLRRNRVRLLAWTVVLVALFAYVEVYYRDIFSTQRALDEFAAVSNIPSIKAITGLAAAPNTLGGAVWTKIWMSVVVLLALVAVFLVTRNGRADEEAGRTELLRSRSLGINALSLASLSVISTMCVVVGAAVAVAAVVGGLDPVEAGPWGSIVMGASIAAIGLVSVGIAALVGQLTATSRAANGLSAVVIGVFYLVRLGGDLGDNGLIWASPIGWAEQMSPWGANRWAPFVLLLASAGALVTSALVIESRRDLGASLFAEGRGPAHAPKRYTSPLVLALRLQRWSLVGWTAGVAVTALICGSVVNAMTSLLADAGGQVAAILRGTGSQALLAMLASMVAMLVAAFAVQATTTLRSDESSGTVAMQLAGALSRGRWLLQRLAIPALGSLMMLCIGSVLLALGSVGSGEQASVSLWLAPLAYGPAVLVYVGLSVAVFGWAPRACIPLSWAVLAATWLVLFVGDALRLPSWVSAILPMSATPYLPAQPMSWTPIAAMLAAALSLSLLGWLGFRRRDLDP